jgi:hypothetical protein
VLRLITALVTNAWRSIQLLNYGIEMENMTYTKTKLEVNQNGIKWKDFMFNLAMALIRSADKWMYVVYLISPGCDPVMGDNRAKQ